MTSSTSTYKGHEKRSPSSSSYGPCTVCGHPVREIRAGCRSRINDLISVRLRRCSLWKNVNLVMVSLRGDHLQIAVSSGVPFGLFLSLPCTGGWWCRSLSFPALLLPLGMFSWPGFDMAAPPLNNHSSEGVYNPSPGHPGIWKSCLKGG